MKEITRFEQEKSNHIKPEIGMRVKLNLSTSHYRNNIDKRREESGTITNITQFNITVKWDSGDIVSLYRYGGIHSLLHDYYGVDSLLNDLNELEKNGKV